MTKEERREYQRRWRAENPEKVKEYKKRAYIKSILNGTLKYNPPTPEKAREYNKSYYERHKNDEGFKKARKEYYLRWREKNRDKWNAYQNEYQKKKRLESKNEN